MAAPCCKEKYSDRCELTTLSASQIGAGLVFIIYLTIMSWSALQTMPPEQFLASLEAVAIVALSTIYYFFSCWLLEEDYVDFLRSLGNIIRWIELLLRVSVLALFGFFSNLLQSCADWLTHNNFSDTAHAKFLSLLLYLSVVYTLFLLWDLIVLFGVKHNKLTQPLLVYKGPTAAPLVPGPSAVPTPSPTTVAPVPSGTGTALAPGLTKPVDRIEMDPTKFVMTFIKIDCSGLAVVIILLRSLAISNPYFQQSSQAVAFIIGFIIAFHAARTIRPALQMTAERLRHRDQIR